MRAVVAAGGVAAVRHRRTISPNRLIALYLVAALISAVAIASVAHSVGANGGTRPAAHLVPESAQDWIGNGTLLTIYGRSLGTAPILGRLGMDHTLNDMAQQAQSYVHAMRAAGDHRPIRIAIHLIYALAIPCDAVSTCLLYLDESGVDIVKDYIKPAARRGWLVVLDDQLGRSTPTSEMEHILAKGYLRYDNVEVAFDPEFRTPPGSDTPGIPVGNVGVGELNVAQKLLSRSVTSQHLLHRKLLLVHQWNAGMIPNRRFLRTDIPFVDPVLIMDGIGAPGDKAHVYSDLLGQRKAPPSVWRGIKIFPPNVYEQAGHVDTPVLSWPQLLSGAPAIDDSGHPFFIRPAPRVIVMT